MEEMDTTFTGVINTTYLNGSWKPEVAVVYNTEGYGMVRPKLIFYPQWDENIYIALYYINFFGDDQYQGFGLYDKLDTVFLQLRYMW